MTWRMRQSVTWMVNAVSLPSDTDRERGTKAAMIVGQIGGLVGSLGLLALWLATGYLLNVVVMICYLVLAGLNLAIYLRTRYFDLYRFNVIWLVLVPPNINQWILGGFTASGGVGLWSMFAPIAALIGTRPRQAVGWLIALLALVGVNGLFEGRISGPYISPSVHALFYVYNVGGIFVLLFGVMMYFASQLDGARERSDHLLLNILPGPIAEKLKQSTATIADRFEEVTVLFADIVDFTTMSANADPREVVNLIKDIFSDFDALAVKHGLEKIKTIGDAYMVAGGLPKPRADHDRAIVEFALDMLKALETRRAWNDQPIRVRIGINTGPVVAGVIGRQKFIYDLWGDAVNTASRMESHGVGNTIQVTESTYQRLKDRYEFESRGVVSIKGKGDMNTYLLRGRKAEAA